ncbi:ferrous iron transport protein A [Psychrosphaera sp. B3R10]|uniref:FeoA family protein n=1 Tax=Psychrosphaera algicola TaxID=3023714 RepID=A0ABT5F7Y2_9GAMM|nr:MULTISPECIES: FeoA family protein [unclassified Psychrosphaera]MBU2880845.1 ferrous iron transport protein A [Psychrosphaera sp. I2R16]MBU2990936.1 ferrous iron transport protein A [Psychrosphaera sp. B3R10]MDC2887531.1 FeoA family protein [Psychrosphaera sp. G1-22]MDO6720735.1 FeoA family protein [Psychrosphaera sp. 1_MG-2023]
MTLWDLTKNSLSTISHLSPTLEEALLVRLMEMGFETNQSITCLRRTPFSGPIVVQLGDSVFSLEQELAQHVYLATN